MCVCVCVCLSLSVFDCVYVCMHIITEILHAYACIYAAVRFDYSLTSVGSITFTPDGPNERTVQLSVDADQLLELNETYLLRLDLPAASITAGVQIGTIYQARVTIINDDSKIICHS